ncbi:MarR family winged helix-turn-helix transcriptional regulator [Subtercola sp. YIM 133946]|uniref:MarR family winged helix-turn-helix transcriptional regulator n=1 Tax=Subtercola sp. YIM 133946 TaxID=3118909 RepID=UPI002F92FD2E
MVSQPEASQHEAGQHEGVGAWAKRYYFTNREALESALRPFGLGSTQWYVLYQLANDGPTMQRDLAQLLHLERATLSGIVTTLVRKNLVDQVEGAGDRRQRMLELTAAGTELWAKLPDPIAEIRAIAFGPTSDADTRTAIRVLREATERLTEHMAAAGRGDDPRTS